LNTFDRPEGYITYDNYEEAVRELDGQNNWKGEPVNITSLNLSYCNLQDILGEVRPTTTF